MQQQPLVSRRPSPAAIVAIVALVASLSGTAFAALGKNSVGTRELKNNAVQTRHIANNAVNGRKVRDGSLTGADFNLAALGTVPSAAQVAQADNVDTFAGRPATCPPGTILLRGTCFDAVSNPPAPSVRAAAEGCAAKGGYLPTPTTLYMARNALDLGSGVKPDVQFTDSYYSNTKGSSYSTVVLHGDGQFEEHPIESPAEYICVYPLVR